MPEDRFAELLSPAYREGLDKLDMSELRLRKSECTNLGEGLSYLRRTVQSRYDIVRAELDRRAQGEPAHNLAELVAQLPKILSGEAIAADAGARIVNVEEVPDPTVLPGAKELYAEIEGVAGSARLLALVEAEVDEIRRLVEDLNDLEQVVSARRRAVYRQLDAVNEEIIRRYQSGEATVDALLR